MNIFVLGGTKSGKSTIAKYIADTYGFKLIQMSKPLKDRFERGDLNIDVYTNMLVKTTLSYIGSKERRKSEYFLNYALLEMGPNNVFDGVRNPRDFMRLFNHFEDMVIKMPGEGINAFEVDGLRAIFGCHRYMYKYMSAKPLIKYHYDLELSIEENFQNNKIVI